MKIDFSQKILNIKGVVMKKPDNEDITLGSICVEALLAVFSGDENLPKADKIKRARLAEKIYDQAAIEVTAEEAVLMQTLVGKGYSNIVVMRADAMLEGIQE